MWINFFFITICITGFALTFTNGVAPGSALFLFMVAAADCGCCLLFGRVTTIHSKDYVFLHRYHRESGYQRSNDVRDFVNCALYRYKFKCEF